jgi:hypothetical protein
MHVRRGQPGTDTNDKQRYSEAMLRSGHIDHCGLVEEAYACQ